MSYTCDVSSKRPMFGHNVSNANNKTLRVFKPNLHAVKVYSNILKEEVSLRISCAGMRTLDKYGGIDIYIAQKANSKLTSPLLALKRRMEKAKKKLESN